MVITYQLKVLFREMWKYLIPKKTIDRKKKNRGDEGLRLERNCETVRVKGILLEMLLPL